MLLRGYQRGRSPYLPILTCSLLTVLDLSVSHRPPSGRNAIGVRTPPLIPSYYVTPPRQVWLSLKLSFLERPWPSLEPPLSLPLAWLLVAAPLKDLLPRERP